MIKIAERFYSIQGEGFWTGTPMCFIRTSQCPVGGPKGICTTWNSRKFVCDTGPQYKSKPSGPEWHSYTEIRESLDGEHIWEWVSGIPSRHLVLTGGEPVVQDIAEIVAKTPWGCMTHIETSGVAPMSDLQPGLGRLWITLSPKEGWLPQVISLASEFKLLVDRDTKVADVRPWVAMAANRPLYLQPIDEEDPEVNKANTEMAILICKSLCCCLSLQTHKFLGVR